LIWGAFSESAEFIWWPMPKVFPYQIPWDEFRHFIIFVILQYSDEVGETRLLPLAFK
jgi:hypothetical protein